MAAAPLRVAALLAAASCTVGAAACAYGNKPDDEVPFAHAEGGPPARQFMYRGTAAAPRPNP